MLLLITCIHGVQVFNGLEESIDARGEQGQMLAFTDVPRLMTEKNVRGPELFIKPNITPPLLPMPKFSVQNNMNILPIRHIHKPPSPPMFSIRGKAEYIQNSIVVEGSVTIENEVIYLSGDIIVRENSSLRIINSTIYMCLVYDGQYGVEILPGGSLILDNSIITASRVEANYYIRIYEGSFFGMYDSAIMYSGFGWGIRGENSGLWINSSVFEICDSMFYDCWAGVYALNSNGTVFNTTMEDCGYGFAAVGTSNIILSWLSVYSASYGIYLRSADGVHIRHCSVGDSIFGIYVRDSNNTHICDGLYRNNTHNIVIWNSHNIHLCRPSILGDFYGIIVLESQNVKISCADIRFHGMAGLLVHSSENVMMKNSTVTDNTHGIVALGSRLVHVKHTLIENNSYYGIYLHGVYLFLGVDLTLYSNHEYGFFASSCVSSMIVVSEAINNSRDVFIVGSENVSVAGGLFRSPGTSIGLLYSDNVSVRNVNVYGYRPDPTVPGIYILCSSDVRIVNVRLYDSPIMVDDYDLDRLLSIDIENTLLDGKPVVVVKSKSGLSLSGFSQIILVDVSDARLRGDNRAYGVMLFYSDNISVESIHVARNMFGLYSYMCGRISVIGLEIEDCGTAIYANNTYMLSLENVYVATTDAGIMLLDCSNLDIDGLIMEHSDYGIYASSVSTISINTAIIVESTYGIVIKDCHSINMLNSLFDENYYTILLSSTKHCVLEDINVLDSLHGVYIEDSEHLLCEGINLAGVDNGFIVVDCEETYCINLEVQNSYNASILWGVDVVSLYSLELEDVMYGVVFRGVGEVYVEGLSILNAEYSLLLDGVSSAVIRSLEVLYSCYGPAMYDSGQVLLYDASITNITRLGLYIEDLDEIIIDRDLVSTNATITLVWARNISINDTRINALEVNIGDAERIVLYNVTLRSPYGINIYHSEEVIFDSTDISTVSLGITIEHAHRAILCNIHLISLDIGIKINHMDYLFLGYSAVKAPNAVVCSNTRNISLLSLALYGNNVAILVENSSAITIHDATILLIKNADIEQSMVGVYITSSRKITLENVEIIDPETTDAWQTTGIYLDETSDVAISDINIHGVYYALIANSSENLAITRATIKYVGYGLTLLYLSNISISNSAISGVGENPYVGIWCEYTRYVKLYNITVGYGNTGIYFLESSDIEMSYSEISFASSYGVLLENVFFVEIWLNTIANNYIGLRVKPKEDLDKTIKIYMNDFVNNYYKHAEDEGSVIWNTTIGNYWSGMEIVDLDQDFINDVPYIIDQDSKDLMPLTCSVWVFVSGESTSFIDTHSS